MKKIIEMKKNIYLISIALAALTIMSACKQKKPIDNTGDPEPPKVEEKFTGTVNVDVQNKIGTEDLVLEAQATGSARYINDNGDTFVVKELKYYLSNFKLIGDGNDNYTIPESYALVDELKTANTFTYQGIPAGKYKSLELTIGVDSTRNVSGAQSGDLDPMLGMFWDWNTGYIMAKIEGFSSSIPTANQSLSIHIGGYHGDFNATRKVTINLSQTLIVGDKTNSSITLNADINKWFASPNKIDFSNFFLVSAIGPDAKTIADNYQHMFVSNSVSN